MITSHITWNYAACDIIDENGLNKSPFMSPIADSNDIEEICPSLFDKQWEQIIIIIATIMKNELQFFPNCLDDMT